MICDYILGSHTAKQFAELGGDACTILYKFIKQRGLSFEIKYRESLVTLLGYTTKIDKCSELKVFFEKNSINNSTDKGSFMNLFFRKTGYGAHIQILASDTDQFFHESIVDYLFKQSSDKVEKLMPVFNVITGLNNSYLDIKKIFTW